MVKRTRTTMNYKTLERKLKIKQQNHIKNRRGVLRRFGRVGSSCFACGTRRKKSLKIPKRYLEANNQRRTENKYNSQQKKTTKCSTKHHTEN